MSDREGSCRIPMRLSSDNGLWYWSGRQSGRSEHDVDILLNEPQDKERKHEKPAHPGWDITARLHRYGFKPQA